MYVLIIYAILCGLIYRNLKREETMNKQKEYMIYGMIVLFFVLRFNLGKDLTAYIMVFNRSTSPIKDALKYHMQRNIGYNVWVDFVKLFTNRYSVYMLLTNILIMSICSYVIFKCSKNILLSLALFIGSGALEVYYSSGIRQMLSMTVFLYSFYKFLPEKKYWWYELGCFIALLCHECALPTFMIPLIQMNLDTIKEHKKRILIIATCVSLYFMYFTSTGLVESCRQHGISSPLQHVLMYFIYANWSFSVVGFVMELLFVCVVYMLFIFKNKEVDDFMYLQIVVFISTVFIYISFGGYSLISRVCDFVQFIMIIMIPNLISGIEKKKQCNALLVIFALNGFLLFTDLEYKIKSFNRVREDQITLSEYPYFTVFNKQKVNYWIDTLDVEKK